MEEFALKYVLEKKYINKVLIGVDNYCQIKENIKFVISQLILILILFRI